MIWQSIHGALPVTSGYSLWKICTDFVKRLHSKECFWLDLEELHAICLFCRTHCITFDGCLWMNKWGKLIMPRMHPLHHWPVSMICPLNFISEFFRVFWPVPVSVKPRVCISDLIGLSELQMAVVRHCYEFYGLHLHLNQLITKFYKI